MNLGDSKVTKKEVSKGKYAGRVGRQDWETFIICFYIFCPWQGKEPHSHLRVDPKSRNSPFLRAILEQRSCSGNFPYYLLGRQGFIKNTKATQCKNLVRYKNNFAHTHTQQNKKPRVIIFYLNHDACLDKLLFHRGADVITRSRGEGG